MTEPLPGDAQAIALRTGAIAWLRPEGLASADEQAVDVTVPAVVAFVDSLPVGGRDPLTGLWSASVHAGAVMLTARLVRRRNSPAGIATFTAEGGAAYVSRTDPDVSQLLELGSFAAPQVG